MSHEKVQIALKLAKRGVRPSEAEIRTHLSRLVAGHGGVSLASMTLALFKEHHEIIDVLAKEVDRLTDLVIMQQVD